jgi:hypothetical protein
LYRLPGNQAVIDEEIMDYQANIDQYPIDYRNEVESTQVANGRTTKILDGLRELPIVPTLVLAALMILAMVVK